MKMTRQSHRRTPIGEWTRFAMRTALAVLVGLVFFTFAIAPVTILGLASI